MHMGNMPVRRQTKAAKKKLLIACSIIVGVLLILTCTSFLIDYIEAKKGSTINDMEKEVNYKFYPANFEENIFQNEHYLELYDEGYISFKEGNITIGITRENAHKYGQDTAFMVEMLYAILYGDNDKYNACFTESYYENHNRKNEFTMQMLYNMKIERLASEKIEGENGTDCTQTIFTVEYKIYQNNGTFRRDIGAGSKKQYITIINHGDGWLIDKISTVN